MVEKNLLTMPILEGMKRAEGCLLCYLWLKKEKELMRRMLVDEIVMNPRFMDEVLAAKGFCNRHMHLLYETAYDSYAEDGLAYALYMRVAIERIIEQFQSLSPSLLDQIKESISRNILVRMRGLRKKFSSLRSVLEKAVEGETHCPICKRLWSFDETRLSTLVSMLQDEKFREEFESSKGLCLPHFLSAIRVIDESNLENPAEIIKALLTVETRCLKLAKRYLSEFIRKQSWEFRDDPAGSEVNANYMVLNLLAGAEGLYCRSYRAFSPPENHEGKS